MIIFYGKITGIHGLKGEVEIAFADKSYFASLPILNKNTSVIINDNVFIVVNVKKKNKAFVLSLKNINTIEQAQSLIGFDIYIDSSVLPELDDDTFYEAELIGYKIIDADNDLYGEIVHIYSLPSNYVFEIKLIENGNIVSIPFVNAYFGKSDKKNKTIQIIKKPIFDDNI
ncbi:ribosome maturation factor RimM [uncultured Brachyspira sp.]|uniref:ribosome maturation factor RimM n=1 Tax=uncultured Brachyspira sp. TaxID=221953 RepID=UPI0025D72C0D|nr:ribosome maturation factor RimM [uncultured Brachyspira sp.]